MQGDSFAQPTRLSVSIGVDEAGFVPSLYNTPARKLALEDHLLRRVSDCIKANRIRVTGSGKSGKIQVQTPGQKILKRKGNKNFVQLMFELPATISKIGTSN